MTIINENELTNLYSAQGRWQCLLPLTAKLSPPSSAGWTGACEVILTLALSVNHDNFLFSKQINALHKDPQSNAYIALFS